MLSSPNPSNSELIQLDALQNVAIISDKGIQGNKLVMDAISGLQIKLAGTQRYAFKLSGCKIEIYGASHPIDDLEISGNISIRRIGDVSRVILPQPLSNSISEIHIHHKSVSDSKAETAIEQPAKPNPATAKVTLPAPAMPAVSYQPAPRSPDTHSYAAHREQGE